MPLTVLKHYYSKTYSNINNIIAIAIIPDVNLKLLSTHLESIELAKCKNMEVVTSILPSKNGLVIRAFGNRTIKLKKYFIFALDCIRTLTSRPLLPYMAK